MLWQDFLLISGLFFWFDRQQHWLSNLSCPIPYSTIKEQQYTMIVLSDIFVLQVRFLWWLLIIYSIITMMLSPIRWWWWWWWWWWWLYRNKRITSKGVAIVLCTHHQHHHQVQDVRFYDSYFLVYLCLSHDEHLILVDASHSIITGGQNACIIADVFRLFCITSSHNHSCVNQSVVEYSYCRAIVTYWEFVVILVYQVYVCHLTTASAYHSSLINVPFPIMMHCN